MSSVGTLSSSSSLPVDVVSVILSYANFRDMAQFCLISKAWWNALANIDEIFLPISLHPTHFPECKYSMRFVSKRLSGCSNIDVTIYNRYLSGWRKEFHNEVEDFLAANAQKLRRVHGNLGGFKTVEIISPLVFASNLRTLSLCRKCHVREIMPLLENKRKLNNLTLRFSVVYNDVTLESLHAQIGQLHELRTLDIKFSACLPSFTNEVDWDLLFSGLKQLQEIRCEYLTGEGLMSISRHCPNLRVLNFYNVGSLKDSLPFMLEVIRLCPIHTLSIFFLDSSLDTDDVREICMGSDTLVDLRVNLRLWGNDDGKQQLLEEVALNASGGRVALRTTWRGVNY